MWRYKSFSMYFPHKKSSVDFYLEIEERPPPARFIEILSLSCNFGRMFCLFVSLDCLPRHTDISYMGHWSDKHFMTMISPGWDEFYFDFFLISGLQLFSVRLRLIVQLMMNLGGKYWLAASNFCLKLYKK